MLICLEVYHQMYNKDIYIYNFFIFLQVCHQIDCLLAINEFALRHTNPPSLSKLILLKGMSMFITESLFLFTTAQRGLELSTSCFFGSDIVFEGTVGNLSLSNVVVHQTEDRTFHVAYRIWKWYIKACLCSKSEALVKTLPSLTVGKGSRISPAGNVMGTTNVPVFVHPGLSLLWQVNESKGIKSRLRR